ncbi:linear amide C-N hydrolase [Clostridium saccharobutylicum]|uniref:linear amide C-N hydrolase n=1 Tax=Clostridium saccharobutylicum TaxID=169679 RepID=UPI001FA93996|nr:linear amide C-N hydrolase [Clostridium saccharobutylicum]
MCCVIEQTEKGLKNFQNQIELMANSPDFQCNMTNAINYMNVSPTQTNDTYLGKFV